MLGFRVWDNDEKIFIENPGNLSMNYDGSMNYYCEITHDYGCLYGDSLKRYSVMQSTGIKDADGKEIFEGDILKQTYNWGEVCKQYYVVRNVIDFIQFECTCDQSPGIDKLEIVGNIYQPPGLLEKLK